MKYFFLLFILGLMPACSPVIKPLPVAEPERFIITSVSAVHSKGPMRVSVDGQMVAWGDSGLNLHDLKTGQHKRLLNKPVESIVWSPDGSMLAVTASLDGETHLYVFSRSGTLSNSLQLPGPVGRLQWPESGKLTAGVLSVDKFSFGSHIHAQLFQWDESWRTNKISLFETTIKPGTAAQLSNRLYKTFDFDLSPLGDEVLYTRLYAPPAFAASRHLVLHNLQTMQEKQVAALPLLSGTGRLRADGETALINNGLGQISLQELWSGEILQDWSGEYFDYESNSELLIVNDALYQGLQSLVNLPPESRAMLSMSGQYLLVEWENRLYLLSNYPVKKNVQFSKLQVKKLLKLRRLRSRGLIDQTEYVQSRKRLLN